jgi:hypothetical protein
VSRKNLSRTVIEGGRYHRNQFERNHSHRVERASTRAWIDRARADIDEAEFSAPPLRPRVGKMFYDKLAPAMRWINSHVGRPWNTVYSELCATFDRRTIAGAHVVDSHMLTSVWRGDLSWRGGRQDFVVDAHGILRRGRMYRRSWRKQRAELLAWTKGRRAANTFMGWWWFRAVGAGPPCSDLACRSRHHVCEGLRFHDGIRHVADRALTKGDLRRLARVVDPDLRSQVLFR